jgi:hypothetical protein
MRFVKAKREFVQSVQSEQNLRAKFADPQVSSLLRVVRVIWWKIGIIPKLVHGGLLGTREPLIIINRDEWHRLA